MCQVTEIVIKSLAVRKTVMVPTVMELTVQCTFPCYSKSTAYKHLTGINGRSKSHGGSGKGSQMSAFTEQKSDTEASFFLFSSCVQKKVGASASLMILGFLLGISVIYLHFFNIYQGHRGGRKLVMGTRCVRNGYSPQVVSSLVAQ